MPCSNVSGTKKFLEKQTIILEVNSSKNWSENSDDRSRFALESWEIKNEMIWSDSDAFFVQEWHLMVNHTAVCQYGQCVCVCVCVWGGAGVCM